MRAYAVTLDIHADDAPDDVVRAHRTLRERGIAPTYFVPTSLLDAESMRQALRIVDDGHSEIGTHGHHHDAREIQALASGDVPLDFLQRSADDYATFFGRRPSTFRSPCWCALSPRAFDRLAELGYLVDSSATPQRLGLFSSNPADNPWLWTPREPRFVRPSLLEVPTSSFVIPFGSLSLALLRRWGGLAFASSFIAEATWTSSVVTIQLHAADFMTEGGPPRRRPTLGDLRYAPGRGWGMRYWPLDRDRRRMNVRVLSVLDLFRRAGLESLTLAGVHHRFAFGRAPRPARAPAPLGAARGAR